ncbi:hypothetical protein [Streptomyces virginiae]|uniref:hypothetical protein n=1 Tax=Streptomyces virginiae TaxID=1961 RepID=UPI002DB5BFED|nr:hypothetical protein [Streptomyces sp. CMAA1738]MEC4574225.1 hypothetical protein [Streptomyces sp. CMAA1738]
MRRLGWIALASSGHAQFGTSKADAVDPPRFPTAHFDPEVDRAQLRTVGKGRRSPSPVSGRNPA